MVEVPSLLFQLDELLERVDFLSVGSNDLVQFLYAADRGNRRVADRFDPLSAPVLRALMQIVDKASAGGKPVTLCGELASKPIGALALVALGYRALSLTPSALGPVKAMLLELDADKAEALLRPLIEQPADGGIDPRAARSIRGGRRAATVTMLPEAKLDALLDPPRRGRGRAVAPVAAGDVREAVARVRRARPGGRQDQGLSRGRGRARRSGGADRRSQDRIRDARDGRRRAADARRASASGSSRSCGSRCCRRTRWTSATSSSKSAPAPAATRPRCSPAICSACTSATPPSRAGRPRSSPPAKAPRAATRKSSPRSAAAGRSPS